MASNASSPLETMQAAVAAMNAGTHRFDVTIICTTDDHQAAYWMDRLSSGLLRKNDRNNNENDTRFPLVLAVSEDWNDAGGAGNGLGTLYAWHKAVALAQDKLGADWNLNDELSQGRISAALYHTAGKGTRLAPLPAGENNNKPGVKLPFPLATTTSTTTSTTAGDNDNSTSPSCIPLTVLEAVVKQTGLYARKGRLSVFWGDQVFLPTAPVPTTSTHHIDILCTLLPTAPTAEDWSAQGLDKYGVIAVMKSEHDDHDRPLEAAQVEKVSHVTATRLLASLGSVHQVGPSLGSFSVSATILQALLTEFAPELTDKTEKLDTDPHFWMPLTLSQESYVELMAQKGTDADVSTKHYQRMANFKANLDMGSSSSLGLFGAVNVGREACWWDYGQLKLYAKNSLLLLEDDAASESAALLRAFLGVTSPTMGSQIAPDAVTVNHSYIFGSRLNAGQVVRSLVAGVTAQDVELDGAIVVNCAARKIVAGKGAILYNIMDDSSDGVTVPAGAVWVGVTNESGETFVLQSRMDIDGGTAWKVKVEPNAYSFEQVHAMNKDANIGLIATKRQEQYDQVVANIGM